MKKLLFRKIKVSSSQVRGKQKMMKYLFKKIYKSSLRKMTVCYISKQALSLCTSSLARQRLHSRLWQPRTKGSVSPKIQARGLSCQEKQDFSITHLSSAICCWGKVLNESRDGKSHLQPNHHSWNRGSILSVTCWEYWPPSPFLD